MIEELKEVKLEKFGIKERKNGFIFTDKSTLNKHYYIITKLGLTEERITSVKSFFKINNNEDFEFTIKEVQYKPDEIIIRVLRFFSLNGIRYIE